MNPIANTPVFLALTDGEEAGAKPRIAAKALLISLVIIVLFAAFGKLIFHLFGITLSAFRVMGGILIALVGYRMLQGGEHSAVQHPSEDDKQNRLDAERAVTITPLAMPMLAGPGTITTAMNYASHGGLSNFIVTVAAFAVLCIINYFFFVSGERFVKYLGVNGLKVVTRLMGLILAVIGVQMLIQGGGGAVIEFQAKSGV